MSPHFTASLTRVLLRRGAGAVRPLLCGLLRVHFHLRNKNVCSRRRSGVRRLAGAFVHLAPRCEVLRCSQVAIGPPSRAVQVQVRASRAGRVLEATTEHAPLAWTRQRPTAIVQRPCRSGGAREIAVTEITVTAAERLLEQNKSNVRYEDHKKHFPDVGWREMHIRQVQ